MHKKKLDSSQLILYLSHSVFLSLSPPPSLSLSMSFSLSLYHLLSSCTILLTVLVCDSHPWHSSVTATKDCILIGALFLGTESWQRWIFYDTFYNVFTKHKPSNVYILILQGIC